MNTKKIVSIALFISIGIVLQLLESLIPIFYIVPGFKIGFGNLASLLALELYDRKSMVIVGILRVFLASLLQGTFLSIPFWLSLSGCLCASVAMIVADKSHLFSLFGISILGASFHHIGQVVTITFLYQQFYMQMYLPILLSLSICSGLVMAMITNWIIERMQGSKETGYGR